MSFQTFLLGIIFNTLLGCRRSLSWRAFFLRNFWSLKNPWTRECHASEISPETEQQVSYINVYVNLENDTDDFICKAEIDTH